MKQKKNHSFLSEDDTVSMKGLSNEYASYLYGYPTRYDGNHRKFNAKYNSNGK